MKYSLYCWKSSFIILSSLLSSESHFPAFAFELILAEPILRIGKILKLKAPSLSNVSIIQFPKRQLDDRDKKFLRRSNLAKTENVTA